MPYTYYCPSNVLWHMSLFARNWHCFPVSRSSQMAFSSILATKCQGQMYKGQYDGTTALVVRSGCSFCAVGPRWILEIFRPSAKAHSKHNFRHEDVDQQ